MVRFSTSQPQMHGRPLVSLCSVVHCYQLPHYPAGHHRVLMMDHNGERLHASGLFVVRDGRNMDRATAQAAEFGSLPVVGGA